MFTGIVEERAVVEAADGRRITVRAPGVAASDSEVGASVSVSGVCLTVREREDDLLTFHLSEETLARTTLGAVASGDHVNLERPVTLLTRLGGHLVQGHIDGVGTVSSVEPAESRSPTASAAPWWRRGRSRWTA
jgi:riboflavin synthase